MSPSTATSLKNVEKADLQAELEDVRTSGHYDSEYLLDWYEEGDDADHPIDYLSIAAGHAAALSPKRSHTMAQLPQQVESHRAFDASPELPPAGTYIAVCTDIRDQPDYQQANFETGKIDSFFAVAFQFGFLKQGKIHHVAKEGIRLSSHDKSTLVGMLTAWNGVKPAVGFDTEAQRGKGAMITIGHQVAQKSGKTYAKLISVVGVPEGIPLPAGIAVKPAPVAAPDPLSSAAPMTPEEKAVMDELEARDSGLPY